MTPYRFAAVILAAGYSTRMGRFKPLLSLGRCTVIEQVIDTFRSAGVDDILVVTGHQKEDMVSLLAKLSVQAVDNPDYQQGMFSSIVAGVRMLSPQVDAFFVMPGDMPLVHPLTVQTLMRNHARNPGRILKPVYQGKNGHPPLIPASFARTILDYTGDGGLREVLNQNSRLVLRIDVSDRNILVDMDRPGDFRQVLHSLSREKFSV